MQAAKKKPPICNNPPLKEKVEEIYNILNNTKDREIDTQTLEIVLNTQQLLEEIENNDG